MENDMNAWKLLLLGLAAPLAAAALAHDATLATAGSGPVTCSIRTVPVAGGVRLDAVAMAKKPVSGTYRLSVGSDSDGSSNTIVQGGEFDAAPGAESVLSTVMLGSEAGDGFEARLTVKWPGGSASCSANGSSAT
jgi:hypothetical protein